MRRLFAVSLFALLLGVGVVALIETDPGYVLVSYGKYTMETSLWVGLVVLALVLFVFYLLLRTVYQLIGGRRSLIGWLGHRRSSQAARASTRGVISFTEGNWARARRQLLRGVHNNESPLVNYLLAARASDRLEEPEQVSEYLQAAGDAEPHAAVAIEIVRAESRLRNGQFEQALAVLDKAKRNLGKYPYVLGLMLKAYEGMQDWDNVLGLLPELRKHKQLSDDEAGQIERDIHQRRLQGAPAVGELHSAWQSVSSALKQDSGLLQLYIGRLVELGDNAAAEKTLLRALKRQWDSELVRHYGLIEGDNASARLAQAERWLPQHPEDAELLLCLGRLCLRDNLWGKARDYFESSYRLEPGAEVCAELGRLLVGLGEPKVAAAYYREGLARTEAQLPELPQPDKVISNHHLLERLPAD